MRLARSLGLTLLLSLAGLTANATTLTIDRDLPHAAAVVGASFAADAANHRAWVVVDFVESNAEEGLVRSERVAVPGLSYDPATRTIRLQNGEKELTCAVGRKVLWATSFRATSECPIRVRISKKTEGGAPVQADKTHIVVEVGAAS
ncbi:MAG TPA: hypothetical protein VHQ90_00275 [Thermoanaerobaculia bacterium]|nr:hypothetical protein [Thermoanaerobaculia bacterium]